jgi:hypothetical protein
MKKETRDSIAVSQASRRAIQAISEGQPIGRDDQETIDRVLSAKPGWEDLMRTPHYRNGGENGRRI